MLQVDSTIKEGLGPVLISGPEGTGVNEYARECCDDLLNNSEKYQKGIFLQVKPSGKRGYLSSDLEQFKELVFLKPGNARNVFLIEDIHKMSPALQDTLLKILEDTASSQCVIVLTTSDIVKVSETVTSRCAKYGTDFRIGKSENADNVLAKVSTETGIPKEKLAVACNYRPLWLEIMHEEGSLKMILNVLEVLADAKRDNKLILKALNLVKEKDSSSILNYSKESLKALHLSVLEVLRVSYIAKYTKSRECPYLVTDLSVDDMVIAMTAVKNSYDNLDMCTANTLIDALSHLI